MQWQSVVSQRVSTRWCKLGMRVRCADGLCLLQGRTLGTHRIAGGQSLMDAGLDGAKAVHGIAGNRPDDLPVHTARECQC